MVDTELFRSLDYWFTQTAHHPERLRAANREVRPRELLHVFSVLDESAGQINRIKTNLLTFQGEDAIGMKVHFIHKAGKDFSEFASIIANFLAWIGENPHWSHLADLTSDTEETHKWTTVERSRVYFELFEGLKHDLQATRSPNPEQFPSAENVNQVVEELRMLLLTVTRAQQNLKDYAIHHFRVEDFFA